MMMMMIVKESMEMAKASSTNFVLWDDVEGSGKNEHQLWVGSMNGAARNTVVRGKSCKLAGTLINKNLVPNESMHPKVGLCQKHVFFVFFFCKSMAFCILR